MAAFDEAWEATGLAEGGYVNDPDDPGKETNWGITVSVARANGYVGEMTDLSRLRARSIAKDAYWMPVRLDYVADYSRRVALEVFDTAFNMGRIPAISMLQRALNALNRGGTDYQDLDTDGKIGSKTLRSLSRFLQLRGTEGETVLLRTLNGLQLARYVEIVEAREKSEKYFFGWVSHRVVV